MTRKRIVGVSRTTFIIGEDGTIEKIIEKVKTKNTPNRFLKNWNCIFF
ncbi:hypothetical protein ES705_50963 [subsurface metagenome]